MNLKEKSKNIRIRTLNMIYSAQTEHIGSCFSCVEILTALYSNIFKQPLNSNENPYFILSKGHAAASFYATLCEFNGLTKEQILTYCKNGSPIYGEPNYKVEGVELSTGSLGHGLPFAAGLAYAGKLSSSRKKIYILVGNGEMNEGSNWEALLFIAHHNLKNLVLIVDDNNINCNDFSDKIINLNNLNHITEACGWQTIVVDGHNTDEIIKAFTINTTKPLCVIAKTIKGKGVSFMENKVEWHNKAPSKKEYDLALAELGEDYEK